MMPSTYMAGRLTLIRQHLAALTHAVPSLPTGFERAGAVLMRDFERHGLIGVLLLIAGFVVLGFGGEQLYYRAAAGVERWRSEEHTSELQSLMRISYAVFCLK